jgi:hypothetical protein
MYQSTSGISRYRCHHLWISLTVQIAGNANTNYWHISRANNNRYLSIAYINKTKTKGCKKALLGCIPGFREDC